jgi:hypothetical protein
MICFQLRYVGKIGRRCYEPMERVGPSIRLGDVSRIKRFRLAQEPLF